jgi:tRNA pseudouridine38-40 synthase
VQKYAVLFSYVGTQYCGWQKQKGSAAEGFPSIQATIDAALSRITNEEVSVVGSGRTDSGVHAVGQVAHFVLKNKIWEPRILARGLNSALPIEIRAIAVQPIDLDFHAQRSAEKKQYSYYFQQGPCALPNLEPYSWWIHKRLDSDAMQAALDHLKGEHDFKPFQSSGAKPGPTVRRILEAEVTRERPQFPGIAYPSVEFVRVRIVGTGFLKQMVRGISGTLLQVGENRRPPSDFQQILASGDRSEVGPTAPARALWLEQVWYPEKYRLFSELLQPA